MQWMVRLAATGLLLAVTATWGVAFAQVPQTLNYQGYLTDSSGQALQDSVIVEFAIYNVETGGTPIWSEFQSVFPSQGLFSTSFGNVANPFPAGMFDTPLYLGIKVSTDDEMTPRAALASSAFSMKALDSETLSGFTSTDLDQSGDIATLTGDLSSTQADIVAVQSSVGLLNSGLADAESDIAILDSDIATVASSVTSVETDVTTAQNDITAVEIILPTKQDRVTGTCPSGSSIRQIFSGGTVSCETDDAGPWLFDGDAYVTGGTRVGIGTTAPAAALMIDAQIDEDPFRARVASSTKLRVHNNGSVSVGTSAAGVENGLHVAGFTGLGTSVPSHQLTVRDTDWQMLVNNPGLGGAGWYVGSSADAWAAGGGKFLIGPTTSSSAAALAIDSTRNVGIGLVAPDTRLHVAGGSDVNAVSGGFLTIGNTTGSHLAMDNNEIMARSNGVSSVLALNAEGGEVTVNSGGSRDHDSLRIRGRVYFDNGGNSGMRITATNSNPTNALLEPTSYEEALIGSSTAPFWRMYSREFYASSPIEYRTYSDRSLKSNVNKIDGALQKITALEGVSYELSQSPMGQRKRPMTQQEQFVNDNQLGFIAQDLEKVLPQLVSEDESSGLKTVAYLGLIPVLVEALKEQQQQLDAQRAELDELKARLK